MRMVVELPDFLTATRMIECACADCRFNTIRDAAKRKYGCQRKEISIYPNGKCSHFEGRRGEGE